MQTEPRSQPSREHGEGQLPRTVSQLRPRQTRWPWGGSQPGGRFMADGDGQEVTSFLGLSRLEE